MPARPTILNSDDDDGLSPPSTRDEDDTTDHPELERASRDLLRGHAQIKQPHNIRRPNINTDNVIDDGNTADQRDGDTFSDGEGNADSTKTSGVNVATNNSAHTAFLPPTGNAGDAPTTADTDPYLPRLPGQESRAEPGGGVASVRVDVIHPANPTSQSAGHAATTTPQEPPVDVSSAPEEGSGLGGLAPASKKTAPPHSSGAEKTAGPYPRAETAARTRQRKARRPVTASTAERIAKGFFGMIPGIAFLLGLAVFAAYAYRPTAHF